MLCSTDSSCFVSHRMVILSGWLVLMLCAANSSCFFTVTGLWYWVADWYNYCVLQTAVASLQSPYCDTECLIGINVVCCRQQLLRYSHRILKLCDWMCSNMCLTEEQYVTDCTELCDLLFSNMWLTLQQYVSGCAALWDWMYGNVWLTEQKYVTFCTGLCDWLYSNICLSVQQYVTYIREICDRM